MLLALLVVAFTAAAVSARSPLFHALTSSSSVQKQPTTPEQRTALDLLNDTAVTMTLLPATHVSAVSAVFVANVAAADIKARGVRNQMTFAMRLPTNAPFTRASLAAQVLAPELMAVKSVHLVQGSAQWVMLNEAHVRSPMLLVRLPPALHAAAPADRAAGNVEEYDADLFVVAVDVEPGWSGAEEAARAHYTLSVRVSDQLTDDSADAPPPPPPRIASPPRVVVWVTAPYTWAAVVTMSLVVIGIASLTCVIRLWCEQREWKKRLHRQQQQQQQQL